MNLKQIRNIIGRIILLTLPLSGGVGGGLLSLFVGVGGGLCLFTSCYDDEGNYDYREINEIGVDTSDGGTFFAVDRFDTLHIDPRLTFTQGPIDESQLDFKWEMYLDDWANSDDKAVVLSAERVLHVQMTRKESSLPYAVVLNVTDRSNGCSFRQKYQVSIQPSVLSGLMVLQDCGGAARLDYFATPKSEPTFATVHHIVDVLGSANEGRQLAGAPRGVAFTLLNKSSYEPQLKRVFVWTDRELMLLSANDFALQHSNGELFMEAPATLDPQCLMRADGTHTMLINNGDVHTINLQTSMSYGYQFSRPLQPNSSFSGARMKFSPWVYQPDEFPSWTGFGAILYDTVGKRFVKMENAIKVEPELKPFEQQNDAALKHFDVNNIGKDLLWMGKGNAGQGFAVFTSDADGRQIYRCRFNIRSTTEDEEGNTVVNPQVYNVAMGVYSLSAAEGGDDARLFDAGRYANYLLYATDRNIYTYDFAARKATLINDAFPEGEAITAMRIYNVENSTANINDISGTVLYVATWDGSEGRVYEFALNRTTGRLNNRTDAAGGNLKLPLGVYRGFGKVVDLCVKCQGRSD